jgi:RNA polymerase-binding transcription factor DksA
MLTRAQIDTLEAALVEREQLLRGEVRKAIHEKYGRDIPELESLGDDSARSVADLLSDIDTGIMMRDVDELTSIESARKAIREGSYGACETCHQSIGIKRLIALPSATRCLPCQEHHERATGSQSNLEI